MTKSVFLSVLSNSLVGLPKEDIAERLEFYSEAIDDRMEDGLTEEEAVADVGPINRIVSQALAEVPLSKIVKEKVKPERKRSGLATALLIIGFPVWGPLLLASLAVILAVFISIWALIVSLWAVEVSLFAGAFGASVCVTVLFIRGNLLGGFAAISVTLVLLGLAILGLYAAKALSKGLYKLTGKVLIGIKSLLIGRRKEQ